MQPQALVVMVKQPGKSPLISRGHQAQELFFIIQCGPVHGEMRQIVLGYNWCTS
jgi:hypothetical protein